MIPLAAQADAMIRRLAKSTSSAAIAQLDGATLLGERAMLANWAIPGRVSGGGGAHLYEAMGDTIALNLARPDDRTLLPALFESDALDADDDAAIAERIRGCDAEALVMRGRSMGRTASCAVQIRRPLRSYRVVAFTMPSSQSWAAAPFIA